MMYFSESLAFELRDTAIKVMCLCPGGTETEFFQHSGQKITRSGYATMMKSEDVVRSATQAMLKGNAVFIPGFLNKLACFFPRFLPRSLGLYLAFKTMNQAVERVPPPVSNS
jgi:short-subunit dehydrogenase